MFLIRNNYLQGRTLKVMVNALIGALFFMARPALAAEVVINEVFANPDGPSTELTEFIELYNLTDNNIDISNYKLTDKVKEFTIKEATISAKGFLSFRKSETNISLNNSDEIVKLFDDKDDEIDSYSYSNTKETKSFSRIPDGTGQFVSETEPTESQANQAPPSPSPSPAPSPSPSPAKASPSPNPSPNPSPLPSPSGSDPEGEPTRRVLVGEELRLLTNRAGEVKGASKSTEASASGKNKTALVIAVVLITGGLGLIGGAGVVLYKQQRYNKNNDKKT